MTGTKSYALAEVSEIWGFEHAYVVHCVRSHWVVPAEPIEVRFDEEDVARLKLIRELQTELGVNDDAIPIILHLLDQLNYIRVSSEDWEKRSA
ncbi:MAG: hypothetical protein H7222_07820 [Methylotenera sp.]|nr:hypothetical protein [Oligoflexia bacterium]